MDIGRTARQLDDASFWVIADVALGPPNIITWQSLGGGPAPTADPGTMILRLTANTGYMDDSSAGFFSDFSGTIEKTSLDADWDAVTQQIVFNTDGYYRVSVQAGMRPFLSYYVMTDCHYGTRVADGFSAYITSGSTSGGGFLPKLTWHDEFFISVAALAQSPIEMSIANQVYPDYSLVYFSALVAVQRVL